MVVPSLSWRWLLFLSGIAISVFACADDRPLASAEVAAVPPVAAVSPVDATPGFREEAGDRGLDFVHWNGMTGDYYYSEMMGAGAALFDADGDGDLDLFLVQGQRLGSGEPLAPVPAAMQPLGGRLYRNDLAAPGTGLTFRDVTAASAIVAAGYGMGAAAGDIDNDGHIDLYLTNQGANQLWRNQGDGTFRDVTAVSGAADDGWSASAAFFDYDRDGWLDLYIVNYVDFTVASHKLCRSLTGAPDYCGPLAFRPLADRLLHNLGNGSFEDVSARLGITAAAAGLGVVSGDFDGDGWPDLYVANDGMPNFLWMQRDGVFRDEALVAGNALNRDGQAEAGMGLAAGDVDGDGDEDLLVTHLALETNTLYRNDGTAFFEDLSVASGLGSPSWDRTGFGTAFLDFDNDGWLDLLTVNGAVKVLSEQAAAGDPHPLRMSDQLFRNLGEGNFQEIVTLAAAQVSRGLAIGDVDNDGDVDAVITANHGPVRLLLNQRGQASAWLGLRLVDRDGRRDMLGATARLAVPGAAALARRVRSDGSYLSASDPRLLFGLGAATEAEELEVEVTWPAGQRERFAAATGRYTTLRQGTGRAATGGAS